MANEKLLNILTKGVEAWNDWKDKKSNRLAYIDFAGVNFSGANLENINFSGAMLENANLSKTKLNNSRLDRANLNGANLSKAELYGAYLYQADFSRANLVEASLEESKLIKSCLFEVDLRGTELFKADLTGANLTGANLTEANLFCAQLVSTNLTKADITGTHLYGTSRDNWKIDGIKCDYIYWDSDKTFVSVESRRKSLKKRIPKDRNFLPGEFEEHYKQLPKFEYYFEHGFNLIDIAVMDRVVQGINEKHSDFDLKLKNFETTGTPHATFTVLHEKNLEEAQQQLRRDYENRMSALEGKQEQMMNMIGMLLGNPQLPSANISAHLNQIRTAEEAQTLYTIQSQKIGELRKAYIVETDASVKFKQKQQITQAESELQTIEQRLEELEGK